MDKIGPAERRSLLSHQVSGTRYFFLDLVPRPRAALAVMLGGRERCNPDYLLRRERYAYHVLEVIIEGSGRLQMDGRASELRPGTVFVSGPRTRIEMRTEAAAPLVKYFFCLSGRHCGRRLAQAGLGPGRVRTVAPVAEIASLAEDLIREGQHEGQSAREICRHLLEVMLLKLGALARRPPVADASAWDRFLQCKALIDVDAEELMSLRDIAERAALEESSVCRLFRRYQGTSPYQYLLRRKMNLAAEFLLQHHGLVKEAAQSVGFADPYHFSRVFKSVHGLAPRELMQLGRGAA